MHLLRSNRVLDAEAERVDQVAARRHASPRPARATSTSTIPAGPSGPRSTSSQPSRRCTKQVAAPCRADPAAHKLASSGGREGVSAASWRTSGAITARRTPRARAISFGDIPAARRPAHLVKEFSICHTGIAARAPDGSPRSARAGRMLPGRIGASSVGRASRCHGRELLADAHLCRVLATSEGDHRNAAWRRTGLSAIDPTPEDRRSADAWATGQCHAACGTAVRVGARFGGTPRARRWRRPVATAARRTAERRRSARPALSLPEHLLLIAAPGRRSALRRARSAAAAMGSRRVRDPRAHPRRGARAARARHPGHAPDRRRRDRTAHRQA